MKHATLVRAFAVMGIASLALTACSSDSGEDTAGPGETTAAESAEIVSTDC